MTAQWSAASTSVSMTPLHPIRPASRHRRRPPETAHDVFEQLRNRSLEAVAPQAAAKGDRSDGEHRATGRRIEIHDLAACQVLDLLAVDRNGVGQQLLGHG